MKMKCNPSCNCSILIYIYEIKLLNNTYFLINYLNKSNSVAKKVILDSYVKKAKFKCNQFYL